MFYLENTKREVIKTSENFQELYDILVGNSKDAQKSALPRGEFIPRIKDENDFSFFDDGTGSGFTALMVLHSEVKTRNGRTLKDDRHPQLTTKHSLYKQEKLTFTNIKSKVEHLTIHMSRKAAWLFIERLKELRTKEV